jgi:hypothetical protein
MSGTGQDQRQADGTERATDYDAVIVGAGYAGLYALHKLRNVPLSGRAQRDAWLSLLLLV